MRRRSAPRSSSTNCASLRSSTASRRRKRGRSSVSTRAGFSASSQSGLSSHGRSRGGYSYMTRIALMGAGSVRFTRKLVADLLHFPELRTASLELHDIDADRLETARRAVEGVGAAMNATPAIHATLNRRAALLGADFVINLVQVGGLDATLLDFEV